MKKEWQEICATAKTRMTEGLKKINQLRLAGGDINEKMIQVVKNNWRRAGLPEAPQVFTNIRQIDALQLKSPFSQAGVMVFNPPYGERLEIKGGKRGARDALPKNNNSEEFINFLQQFGAHLKQHFAGWQVDVLTADMGLPGQLRMKESKRTPLFNGPLECRLFRFEMRAAVASI